MIESFYRFTASDIDIEKEGNGINQRIKFIAYVYLHEITYSPPITKKEIIPSQTKKTEVIKENPVVKKKDEIVVKQKNTSDQYKSKLPSGSKT